MSRWRKLLNFFLGGLLLVLVMYGIENTNAHDDHHDDGGDISTDVSMTGGDLISGDTGDNKSLVIAAPGLGDVDIAQCLGSEAWTLLIGGKQKLVLNQVCMAEFYLKQGRYDLAAQALCNQAEILSEYSSEQACEAAHDLTPAIPDHDIHTRSETFEEVYPQQQEEIEYAREERASLVGQIDQLVQQIHQRPQMDIQADKRRREKARAALEDKQ